MITGRIIKTTLLCIMLVQGAGLMAQKKYAFTVNDAVRYAVQNVTEIRNLQVDRKIQLSKSGAQTARARNGVGRIASRHEKRANAALAFRERDRARGYPAGRVERPGQ